MLSVQILIDKAIDMCGSAAELARRMEIDRAEITKLRKGTRPASPEIAAEIADIAGMDARQAAIDAIIERNAANRKGALLADILGKGQAVGVAAMLDISYSGDSKIDTAVMKNDSNSINNSIHRIYQNLSKWFRRSAYGGLPSRTRCNRPSAA